MPIIGVRELRERTSEILGKIREEGAEYVITLQGKPVALLLPAQEDLVERAIIDAGRRALLGTWESYASIARKIRQDWPPGRSTADALDRIRR